MVWLDTYNAKTAIFWESSLDARAGCPSSLCCRHSSMHGIIFVVSMFCEQSIPMNCAISMLRNNRMQTYFARPLFPKTPPRVFQWHQSDIEHIEHSTFSHESVSISDKSGSLVPRGHIASALAMGLWLFPLSHRDVFLWKPTFYIPLPYVLISSCCSEL